MTWQRTQILFLDNFQSLDLWGSCDGITIYLEWEKIQEDFYETTRTLQRLIISAFHPKTLLMANALGYAAHQERLLEIGYQLAGVDFVQRFYEEGLWRKQIKFEHFSAYKVDKDIRLSR